MRKEQHKQGVVFFLFALMGLMACSKVPDGILPEKRMQQVLVDMQLAEAMISGDYKTYQNDTIKAALFRSVFNKHKITEAEYDSSLVWYGRNIDIYMAVYDRVINDLNQRITDLGDVQADAAPASLSDSVDIWPRRRLLTFQPGSPFNGVTFDIKPETNYSSGSSFVLGMEVWGLTKGMRFHPEVRLSVDQGDTTLTVNNQITQDGYHETILKSLPTKKVRRVYGFIRLNDADSSYYKIYIDSLNLMKYNYGTDPLKSAIDSIKPAAEPLTLSNVEK